MFADIFTKYANNTAFITTISNKITYKELGDMTDKMTGHLYGAGKEKSLIFIFCKNSVETVATYLASLLTNTAALLLDVSIQKEFLDTLIDTYDPDFLWWPDNEGLNHRGKYIEKYKEDSFILYNKKITGNTVQIHKDLALLLMTSGSTGGAKLVRLTLKNLTANAHSIASYLNLIQSERPATTLPLHYSYGLSVINSHLSVGAATLITDESIVTRGFWDFINLNHATSLSGVPYTYEMLKKLRFFTRNLPSIKYMTQAGGKLNPELVKEFSSNLAKKDIQFYVMYGQTEATARISYLPPKDTLQKPTSIGIAIPGGTLSILDNHNEPINVAHTEGELVYHGDNVMMGYANSKEDLASGDELGGTLKTGDIGYYDDDRYFYITGRKKRFLKIHGNRINLDDIERFLNAKGHPCVCGGVDDFLRIATLQTMDPDGIKNIVGKNFGIHHSVVDIFKIEEIPKNTSGKILYGKIFG